MSARDETYEVGYKRPPAATRFKPGQSGNPAGRPKGRKNFSSLIQEAANREIEVTVGSKKRSMTMAAAFVQTVFKAALSGNTKVFPLVVMLLQRHLSEDESIEDGELSKKEREFVSQFLGRRGGTDEPSSR